MNDLEVCVIDLGAKGVTRDRAMRACVVAQHSKSGNKKFKNIKLSDIAVKVAADSSKFSDIQIPDSSAQFRHTNQFELDPILRDPIYPFSDNPTVPVLIREALMVRIGKWNGIEIDSEALDEFIANFDPANPIPIICNHDETKVEYQCGWVLSMRRDGDKIIGLCELIGSEVVEKVQTRRLKKTSIGFNYGSLYRINEYSFVVRPAVPDSGLIPVSNPSDPAQFGDDGTNDTDPSSLQSEGCFVTKSKESQQQNQPRKENQTMPDDPKTEPAPATPGAQPAAGLSAPVAPPEVPKTSALSASDPLLVSILATQEAQNAKLAAQDALIASLTAKNEKLEKESNFKQVELQWTAFAVAGKSLPACKEDEIALMTSFSPEQMEKFKAIKEKQGNLISFGRLSIPSLNKEGDDPVKTPGTPEYENKKAEMAKYAKEKLGSAGFKKEEATK